MIKREEVVLLRMPLLRLRFPRREWQELHRVRVGVGLYTVVVDIVKVDAPSVHGGHRRWLRCACGRRTSVLGLSCATGELGCRRCLGWRSRSRSAMSPQVVHASAGIVANAEVPPTPT